MGIRVWTASLVLLCCASGQTPSKDVFSAIRENNTAAVKTFAAHRENMKFRGPRDTTPLMYAAAYGSIQSMKILLKGGADADAVNAFGATALMWSVSQPEKVKLLLDHKANVNIKAKDGRTALMLAAASPGSDRVVDLLLEHGADPKITAPDGSNFLNAAVFGMNPHSVQLALAAGLDVFATEPNVPDELRALQNVVLLPHIGSASVVTRNAMDQLVVDNLRSWFAGKPPLTPVPETPVKAR